MLFLRFVCFLLVLDHILENLMMIVSLRLFENLVPSICSIFTPSKRLIALNVQKEQDIGFLSKAIWCGQE